MRIFLTFLFMLLTASAANAQSFTDALTMAYQHNPQLAAAQAELRAVDTSVAEAQSGWRPTVAASASAGYNQLDMGNENVDAAISDVGGSITQPIYRGGRTVAQTKVAKSNVQAQRAVLRDTEQQVLLSAATAYLDVIRDQAIVELNRNNTSVLGEQLHATQERFKVGQITSTDVSQSESRLSGADAERIAAEGSLGITRATFIRVMGEAPGTLQTPALELPVPANENEVVTAAEHNSPRVIAAQYAADAAMDNIDLARGAMLPDASISASESRNWADVHNADALFGSSSSGNVSIPDHVDIGRVTAQLRVPLYSGGADYAKLSGARETATRRKLELDNARRLAREQAISAWSQLQTAKAVLAARQAQIRAAELAAKGTRAENKVGSRALLDVLDTQHELLSAQVSQLQAERDVKVATLGVLAAMGRLTPETLHLPGPYYDPQTHYDRVDGSWFGG